MKYKMEEKEQISSQSQCHVPNQKQIDYIDMSQSTVKEQYQQIMNGSEDAQKWKKQLLRSKRFKWKQKFKEQLANQTIQTDLESKVLLLHYGNYQVEVNVLTTALELNLQNIPSAKILGRGAYGFLVLGKVKNKYFAIKNIKTQIEYDSSYLKACKEYFMNLLASELQIGPKIVPYLGYDIIILKQHIIFTLELCQQPSIQKPYQLMRDSFQNLKIFHSFNFQKFWRAKLKIKIFLTSLLQNLIILSDNKFRNLNCPHSSLFIYT